MAFRHLLILALFLLSLLKAFPDGKTHFLNLPLDLSPEKMMEELRRKGLLQEGTYEMSGRLSGMPVRLTLHPAEDTTGINSIVLTTKMSQGGDLREDYQVLRQWMCRHYGVPVWESTVRSHAFARWYLGAGQDIVMIATARPAVEIWFYNSHDKRNIDYYSILKYCERNPVDGVPHLTADEAVTWKRVVPEVTTKKVGKKRYSRKKRRFSRSKRRRRR